MFKRPSLNRLENRDNTLSVQRQEGTWWFPLRPLRTVVCGVLVCGCPLFQGEGQPRDCLTKLVGDSPPESAQRPPARDCPGAAKAWDLVCN